MTNQAKQTEIEVDLSQGKVKAVGVYEDVRPLVKTGVDGINHILKVAENVVGLPADFLNHHLGRFRDRYREAVEQIPIEYRELPPFRLICVTMREASYSADEPNLQEFFAQLLLTGSDSRTQKKAFPGFATTIGQLNRQDADMLMALKASPDWRNAFEILPRFLEDGEDITGIVFYNLRRLGLVDFWNLEPNPFFPGTAAKMFEDEMEFARGDADTAELGRGFTKASQKFAYQVMGVLERMHKPFGVYATPYGRRFVEACLPKSTS